MLEPQLVSKHQSIFDTLLDNLWLQCIIKSDVASFNFTYVYVCIDALSIILSIVPDLRLRQSLQKLKEELPNSKANQAVLESWCQTKRLVWAEELNTTIFFIVMYGLITMIICQTRNFWNAIATSINC